MGWELRQRACRNHPNESLRFGVGRFMGALPKLDEGSTQETTRRTDWRHLQESPLVSRVRRTDAAPVSVSVGRLRETVTTAPISSFLKYHFLQS